MGLRRSFALIQGENSRRTGTINRDELEHFETFPAKWLHSFQKRIFRPREEVSQLSRSRL